MPSFRTFSGGNGRGSPGERDLFFGSRGAVSSRRWGPPIPNPSGMVGPSLIVVRGGGTRDARTDTGAGRGARRSAPACPSRATPAVPDGDLRAESRRREERCASEVGIPEHKEEKLGALEYLS